MYRVSALGYRVGHGAGGRARTVRHHSHSPVRAPSLWGARQPGAVLPASQAWLGRAGGLQTWSSVCAARNKVCETTSGLEVRRVVCSNVKRAARRRTDPAAGRAGAVPLRLARAQPAAEGPGQGGRGRARRGAVRPPAPAARHGRGPHARAALRRLHLHRRHRAVHPPAGARPRRPRRPHCVLCLQSSRWCAPHHSGRATHTHRGLECSRGCSDDMRISHSPPSFSETDRQ